MSTTLAKLCSLLIILESWKMESTFPLQCMGVFTKEMYWFLSNLQWINSSDLVFSHSWHDEHCLKYYILHQVKLMFLGVFSQLSLYILNAIFCFLFVLFCSSILFKMWKYYNQFTGMFFTGFVGAWLMTSSGVLHGTGVISRMRLTRSALLLSSSSILHVLHRLSHLEVWWEQRLERTW